MSAIIGFFQGIADFVYMLFNFIIEIVVGFGRLFTLFAKVPQMIMLVAATLPGEIVALLTVSITLVTIMGVLKLAGVGGSSDSS